MHPDHPAGTRRHRRRRDVGFQGPGRSCFGNLRCESNPHVSRPRQLPVQRKARRRIGRPRGANPPGVGVHARTERHGLRVDEGARLGQRIAELRVVARLPQRTDQISRGDPVGRGRGVPGARIGRPVQRPGQYVTVSAGSSSVDAVLRAHTRSSQRSSRRSGPIATIGAPRTRSC